MAARYTSGDRQRVWDVFLACKAVVETSRRTGVPKSTVSKIVADKMLEAADRYEREEEPDTATVEDAAPAAPSKEERLAAARAAVREANTKAAARALAGAAPATDAEVIAAYEAEGTIPGAAARAGVSVAAAQQAVLRGQRGGVIRRPEPTAAPAPLDTTVAALAEMVRQQQEMIASLTAVVTAASAQSDLVPAAPRTREEPPKKPVRQRQMDASKRRRQMWLPDCHAPYHHPDTVAFAKAIRDEYKPDYFGQGGDLWDGHAISYHESDPDLPGARDEWMRAREFSKDLLEVSEEWDVLIGNHDALPDRKRQSGGLPRQMIRSWRELHYGEFDEVEGTVCYPDDIGWGVRYHGEIVMDMDDGGVFVARHDAGKNATMWAKHNMCSVIGFHWHGSFKTEWIDLPDDRGYRFACNGGSMIDGKSLAFRYGTNFREKPFTGLTLIIDWNPIQIRMPRDRHGRWTGRVPTLC